MVTVGQFQLTELSVAIRLWRLNGVIDGSTVLLDRNCLVARPHVTVVVEVAGRVELEIVLCLIFVVGGSIIGFIGHAGKLDVFVSHENAFAIDEKVLW